MRIRKGSEVEVWIQEAASPVGAWRGGEVQWGNGHSYILRWHDGGPDSGRISRKSVRPCPPPAPVPPDLDAGDLVEVFDEEDCLWKCAEVFDGGRQFRVKVVGAPKVLTVSPDRVRLRQILRNDDVWVLLHKDNKISGAGAAPLRANGNGYCGNYKPVAPGINPLKQKRSPCMFDDDAKITNNQRFQGTHKKKLCVREEPRHDNVEVIEPFKENVEVIEVPKTLLNKQDEMGSGSSESVRTGSNSNHDDHHQQQVQHHDKNDDDGASESVSSSDDSSNSDSSGSSDSDDSSGSSDSDDSSSSSDSRTRSDDTGDRASAAPASAPPPPRDEDDHQKVDPLQQFAPSPPRDEDHHPKANLPQQLALPPPRDEDHHPKANLPQQLAPPPPRDEDHHQKANLLQQFHEKDHRDDTAVSFGSWGPPPLNDKKVVHRLELDAYIALTRAFHASGDALSWEKAELLTDLRAHLHVSDDEHLQVINAILNRKRRRFGRPGNF